MKIRPLLKLTALTMVCVPLMLTACAGHGGGTGTGSGAETSTPTPGSSAPSIGTTTAAQGLSLVENGKSVYKVIRSDKASKTVISAASKLRSALSDAAGVNVGIAEDWVKSVDELDPNAFEILVGPTNREASSVTGTLNPKDYVICLKNNSVVITGGSDKAIVEAVNIFIAQCIGDRQILLGETISHTEALACPDFRVGGTAIGDFVPVYSASAEDEEGKTIASSLGDVLFNMSGASLKAVADTAKSDSAHKIFIGPTNDAYSTSLYSSGFDTFDYRLEVRDGNLYLAGGSCFALQYCVNLLRDEYLANGLSLDDGLTLTGSAYGKRLYDLEEGADVRIMSNNAWNCDNNQPAWAEMGEDCSAKVRSVGLAGTYMAYAPDVICFQEMTVQMMSLLRREFKNNGWEYGLITYSTAAQNDYTCILYRTDTLELISKGRHQFDYGSDAGSKSYDWGRFRHMATGKEFIALSTHLWWKSETAQAGSDEMRERQAAEIVAEADSLIAKYGVPVWVMGDFNTRTTSAAFRVFTSGGFRDAFDIATVYADDNSGYHTCTRQTFARETQLRPYKSNAIDHILIKNPGATEVLTFNHIRPYFYIKLSDHYPLYADAKLG